MSADVAEAEDHLQLVFTDAIGLPVGMGPQGPQILPVPAGVNRYPMRKETALDFAEKIKETAEKLPDTPIPGQQRSDLVIANDMQAIDNVAKQTQQFRG